MQISFSALLTSLGIAPKTLPQAQDLLTPAKAQLDAVAALFTAAGLPLEEMLAAGPDSLKAHLASLDQSETIAALNKSNRDLMDQVAALGSELSASGESLKALTAQNYAFAYLAETIGIKATDTAPTPEAIATAFKSHIEKSASALLAKDGRPPVAHVAHGTVEKKPAAQLSDAEHLAAYLALPDGSRERMRYGATHFDAIQRAAAG